eukprot:5070826-Pleurochrysis_carterae.AAC.1
MASPGLEAASADEHGEKPPPPVTHYCAACKKPMLEDDGTPRNIRFIGHSCSYQECKLPLHAPLTCEH